MNNFFKNTLLWIVIAIVMLSFFQSFSPNSMRQQTLDYSTFLELVRTGNVSEVIFENEIIKAQRINGDRFVTYNPETDNTALIGELNRSGVKISASPQKDQNLFVSLLINSFPVILLIGVWIYFMRQMQGGIGGGRGAMSFGKSKAKLLGEDQVNVTFADVAGIEEAKEEVIEIVEFLKDPSKFQRLGGKIPRGVLMVGSPGTGKTLLARAIAGEARVPFFTISGSDFVEMFVGVGASRVRDMFQEAKAHSPCIIFIDEIDAVGRQRGAGLGGGHDEREQTKSQEDILAEESIYQKFTPNKDTALFPKWHSASWKDKLVMLDKFEDERLVGFGKKIIYQESPETLPKEIYNEVKRGIAKRILSEKKEKWWTCKEFYFECDNLREKYSNENDEKKLFIKRHQRFCQRKCLKVLKEKFQNVY